jgi:hypothetical protein
MIIRVRAATQPTSMEMRKRTSIIEMTITRKRRRSLIREKLSWLILMKMKTINLMIILMMKKKKLKKMSKMNTMINIKSKKKEKNFVKVIRKKTLKISKTE